MGIYGLIGSADLKVTMDKMKKFQCDDYLIVAKGMSVKEILQEIYRNKKIQEVELLNIIDIELSNAQLYELFTVLIDQNISVRIIEKLVEMEDEDYFKLIYHVLKRDYDHRSSVQKEKLKEARDKGVILGRPSLIKDEIEEIIMLREKHGLTYREISIRTGASLGTVSKYCQLAEKSYD